MARTLALRLGSVVVSRELVWTFAAVGAALRIRQYLVNRSFWLDESFLSINVIEKPFTKLFGPLQFNQAAPPGFLLVERLATDVFGRSEYVFRAFPLACGLVSIFLFVRLARRLLPSEVVPLAVGLFAISPLLIYYSSEAKSYSTDVMLMLALLLIGLELANGRRSQSYILRAGLVAAVAIQFSAIAVFTVAALGITLGIKFALERSWGYVRALAFGLTPSAVSAALFLWVYHRNTAHYTFEGDVFAKFPTSVSSLLWWADPLKNLAYVIGLYHTTHEVGAPVIVLAALFAIVGAAVLLRRNRTMFLAFATLTLITLVASRLHKYPFVPRALLFLAPALIVVIALGVGAVLSRVRRAPRIVLLALTVSFLGYQAVADGRNAVHAYRPEDIKWQLRFIARNWQPGDVLYLHYPSQFAFTYYQECGCFRMPRLESGEELWPVRRAPAAQPWLQMPRALVPESRRTIVGRFAGHYYPGIYQSDIIKIRQHRRAWILFTFVVNAKEWKFIQRDLLGRLDRGGRRLLTVHRLTSRIYLYQFRR